MNEAGKNRRKTIGDYLAMGSAAVKSHVDELDAAYELYGKSCRGGASLRGWIPSLSLRAVTPKIQRLLEILADRTITEIRAEREAFRVILGSDRRVWEV